jgi:transposase
MRIAVPIELSADERDTLERWARGRSTPNRLVLRAKIVLAAAAGQRNDQIAETLDTRPRTVGVWRQRFAAARLAGIAQDAPRGGRPTIQRDAQARRIIEATTQTKPAAATHWSTRTLAEHLHVSPSMVQRVWKANGLQPHRSQTFKLSNDRQFVEKLVDVVGLYLNPPEHALVLSCDEKSQIQALDRTQPGLPMKKGRCGTMTHDYKRHGTTTLFAALELAEGKLIGTCLPRHRHQEWIKFLQLIDRQTPADLDLHLIADNYFTHKTPQVQRWLKQHPRFHMHFIPTSSSWLNLIERWFRELTDKMIRRGVFTSVAALIEAITRFVDHHNDQPKSFVWTAKVDAILAKVSRARAVLDNGASR